MRRSGKSTVLKMFQERLVRGGISPDNIIDINFERKDEQCPLEAQALYDYVARRLGDGHKSSTKFCLTGPCYCLTVLFE